MISVRNRNRYDCGRESSGGVDMRRQLSLPDRRKVLAGLEDGGTPVLLSAREASGETMR